MTETLASIPFSADKKQNPSLLIVGTYAYARIKSELHTWDDATIFVEDTETNSPWN